MVPRKISKKLFNMDLIHEPGAYSRRICALQIFENTKHKRERKKVDNKMDFPEMK